MACLICKRSCRSISSLVHYGDPAFTQHDHPEAKPPVEQFTLNEDPELISSFSQNDDLYAAPKWEMWAYCVYFVRNYRRSLSNPNKHAI
jgi:hypothetical protein